jgi:hypothetical protein
MQAYEIGWYRESSRTQESIRGVKSLQKQIIHILIKITETDRDRGDISEGEVGSKRIVAGKRNAPNISSGRPPGTLDVT